MKNDVSKWGKADIVSNECISAGSFSSLQFTYTAGAYGMEDSGTVRLAWRMVSDWQTPQFTHPNESGYTTVHTTADATLEVSYQRFIRPYTNSIMVRVARGSLKEGDTITITLGDRSEGSPGARAQSHQEKNHEFRFYADVTGSGVYRLVPQPLLLDVTPNLPKKLKVILPGTIRPNEAFEAHILCLDENGNPSAVPKNALHCEWFGAAAQVGFPTEVPVSTTAGVAKLSGLQLNTEGFLYVRVSCKQPQMQAMSNACLCTKEEGEHLFFGDMHGQNADTLGTGTLDEYYQFAKEIAAMSFVGWQGNDFEITQDTWQSVREVSHRVNEEGAFVSFLGYEWSGATPQGGDYNIYFKNDSEVFYPSSNWLSEASVPEEQVATPLSALWKRFAGRDDVMAIPHVGGRCGNLAYLTETFCPAVEVHSHHGVFDWFALEAMKRRLEVGFVASSDDHSGRLGLFSPSCGTTLSGGFDVSSGYCGLWAKELTKAGVWQALRARHCYASMHNRMYLKTELGTAKMGDETSVWQDGKFLVKTASDAPIDRIYLYNWDTLLCERVLQKPASDAVRIRWCGVKPGGKHKSCNWNGTLQVEQGGILEATEYAFDRDDQGISFTGRDTLQFTSSTSGDFDGIIVRLQTQKDTSFRLCTAQGSCHVRWDEVQNETVRIHFSEHVFVEFAKANEPPATKTEWIQACQTEQTFVLEKPTQPAAFWAKVMDDNGNAAWASPIFVKPK